MVSAVFHIPPLAGVEPSGRARGAARTRRAADACGAAAPRARRVARSTGARFWLAVLPPLLGMALLVGIWALATAGNSTASRRRPRPSTRR